jgi:hypothetical protein
MVVGRDTAVIVNPGDFYRQDRAVATARLPADIDDVRPLTIERLFN